MKKILLILMAMFALGLQNVSAQDAPLKIVTILILKLAVAWQMARPLS